MYADVFEQAWTAPAKFRSNAIARRWFPVPTGGGLPDMSLSFAPHDSPPFTTA